MTVTVVNGQGGGSTDPGDNDGETIVIPGHWPQPDDYRHPANPGRVATDTFALVYDEVETPSGAAPEGFVLAGLSFTLDAYLNQQLQPGYVFATPITLTVAYSDEDVADLPGGETSLELRHWDGSQWRSDGISKLSQDTANNRIVFQLAHLSEFGLFSRETQTCYLPIVVKN
ncbi:MAG: hypothetical protein HC875_28400 [Anaerolineales bacterium]|nr:hypothetical protein [Anaerolineales bacterium]